MRKRQGEQPPPPAVVRDARHDLWASYDDCLIVQNPQTSEQVAYLCYRGKADLRIEGVDARAYQKEFAAFKGMSRA